jgi:type VI secretion system secreted protein Hcp
MAFHAYVSFKGVKQGQFKGESTKSNRKDKWVTVLAFGMGVKSPLDNTTGQASGKRHHSPIVITKEWGAASPQIWQALATNEILSSVDIQITQGNGSGKETVYHTISLTNAQIVSFRNYCGPIPKGSPPRGRYEDVILNCGDMLVIGAAPHPGHVQRFGKWA